MDNFFTQFADFALTWRWPLLLALAGVFAAQMAKIPAGHRQFTAAMSLYFFLLIVAYWILKPIKKALFVGYYKVHGGFYGFEPAQMELLAKETNILIALGMALLLVWLRRRFTAAGFGLAVALLFAAGLVIFIPFAKTPDEGFVWGLYIFGDMFVSSMVALFFATLHDSSSVADARRIYGQVGIGGVLGGLVGSVAAGGLDQAVGVPGALGVSFALTLCVAAIGWRISRKIPAQYAAGNPADTETGCDRLGMFKGARAVLQSRPLLLIASVLLLYEIASVVIDYQFTAAVSRHVSAANLKQYFGAVYTFSNAMALLVQLLLTTWVIRRHSLKLALLVMPMAILLGESAYLLFPVLLTASLLNTTDGAFAYSIQQTAREALYVPLSRYEKYEAKAFIDIVWLRFSKGIAVVFSLGLSLLIPDGGETLLAGGVILLALIWLTLLLKTSPYPGSLRQGGRLQPVPID
ncbi:MAG: Npt1/Npt2 family nucleotide transporter [Thiobacillus sp.]